MHACVSLLLMLQIITKPQDSLVMSSGEGFKKSPSSAFHGRQETTNQKPDGESDNDNENAMNASSPLPPSTSSPFPVLLQTAAVPAVITCESNTSDLPSSSPSPPLSSSNAPQEAAAAPASAGAPVPPRSRPTLRRGESEEALEKKTFLLFVKILFKLLKEHRSDEFTNRAKRVVMECKRRNQQNHPDFSPLMDALERHLRILVGEKIWARAHVYLHHYLCKEEEARLAAASSAGIEPRNPSLVATEG